MEERILCAAIWYKEFERPTHRPINTPGGVVVCGFRHPHIVGQINSLTGKRAVKPEVGEYIDGFLTSKNRFVDRKEAAKIHIANGGTLKYSKDQLFSEDLY